MRAEVAETVARVTDLYAADDVLAAAGSMHLARYVTGSEDPDEAQLACGFFAPLLGRRDASIPPPMREILTDFRDRPVDGAHPSAAIRRVLRGGDPHDGAWADLLEQMSCVCRAQFERTGDLAAGSEAFALLGHAATTTPMDEQRRIDRAAGVCRLAHTLGRASNDPSLLEIAADGLREIAGRVDQPGRPRLLIDLGTALSDLYRLTGDGDVLDEMLAVDRRAVRESAPGATLVGSLTNLGVALLADYAARGRSASLDEACVHLRMAADLAPAAGKQRPYVLTALGGALRHVHHRVGDLAALDEAIVAMRDAVRLQADDDPYRAGRMTNLAVSLLLRHERDADSTKVNEAVDLLRRAEEAALTGTTGEATLGAGSTAEASVVLNGLAAASHARYRSSRDVGELDMAIVYAERAVAAAVGLADRRRSANNAGILLARRHEAARGHDEPTGDYLERAERYLAEGMIDPDGAPGPPEDADGGPATVAANRGAAMALRFEQTGDEADHSAAIDAFRGAESDREAPPSIRAEAAAEAGRLAAIAYDWPGAVHDFATAIALLEQAVPRSMRRDDGEYRLVRLRGLASDAAACALWCNDAAHAVELLEEGRGVLLARTMDFRNDLTRLRERDPGLARELDALRNALDRTGSAATG